MKNNIVITGGGSGIGKEIALNLSNRFNVIICGRKLSKLKAVASKSENIHYFKCDVSKEIEVKKLKNYVSKKFGYLDILINNASVFGEIGPYYQTNSKKWENTFKNNFFSTYICCKIFLDLIKKSKIKKIINVAGGGAFDNFPNFSAYAVSKAAIVRFTETIAQELIKMKIEVYGIAPGFVITPMHNKIFTTGINKVGKQHYKFVKSKFNKGSIPINLVAECIKFLISQKSNGLTGKTISVGFDDWQKKDFPNLIKLISKSNLFSLRRINPINLDKKSKLFIKLNKLHTK